MKKNCVLISSIVIALCLAAGPNFYLSRANAEGAFDDTPLSGVTNSANSSDLETADISVKEDNPSTSGVTDEDKEREKWYLGENEKKDEKAEEKKDEKKDEEKKDEEKKDSKFPVDGTVQGNSLRLREWPWGPVIGKYNTGDQITVTGESGEFYEVTINGVKGYMHKNYVTIPDSEASRVAPYYPGDTLSGGYLSKEDGIKQSEKAFADGTYNSSSNSTSNGANNVSYKGSTDTGDLASYTGGKLPPAKFIALFGPVAQKSMKDTGVPASVTLAQAILETGWGKSSIGNAKNLFGIKGTGPAGKTVVSTQECYDGTYVTIKDGFRMYHNWQESIDDHANLVSNGRYKSAWDAFQANHDADAFARGIHQAGYATSPTYSKDLISLMKQYNLYEWDN
ncbi:MAG: glucosaminidase domain-containing protein [Candidatus Riflebacteria bacterium]|nr:glucosaminidase domain-containing protein [Candidatus Riflebacteria bacterium]